MRKNFVPSGSKLIRTAFQALGLFSRALQVDALVMLLTFLGSHQSNAGGTVTVPDEAHLRAALVGGGIVNFAVNGTILLTSPLNLTNGTTIDATGYNVVLSGGNSVRLVQVNPGVTASFINLALINGFHSGSNGAAGPPVTAGQVGMGAAMLNNGGTVILIGCTLVSNTVAGGAGWVGSSSGSAGGPGRGGAICNLAGNLFVTNCIFDGNNATGGMGGEYNIGSYAGGNSEGGAMASIGGNIIVHNSFFRSNRTQGGAPGGVEVLYLAQGGSGCGGALWASNTVVNLYSSAFNQNRCLGADLPFSGGPGGVGSGKGGALWVTDGSLKCFSCSFSSNIVSAGLRTRYGALGVAQGGAVWSRSSLSVSESMFLGNQALGTTRATMPTQSAGEGSGGAIFTEASSTLSASSFIGNTSRGGNGSTYSFSNLPGGNGTGAGIYNWGTLFATNCSLVENIAVGGDAGLFFGDPSASGGTAAGGGFYNTNGTAWLVNLTFSTNAAVGGMGGGSGPPGPRFGGSIYNTNGTVNLLNTIVANSPSGSNCIGLLTDQGHNLSSDGSASFSGAGSLNNTAPKLGPLDNYGGTTPTLALLSGSPAIDAGANAGFPVTDQRGRARPFGAAPDIGAFESSPPYLIRGRISGSTLHEEVGVKTPAVQTATTNHGQYTLQGLAANAYSVTPESANYLFVPANRSIIVGPDQLDVNFQAYYWNALSRDAVSNGVMQMVFAATNEQTIRLQTSTNLLQWSSISTNTVGSSNYLELALPVSTDAARFYRTATP
jgi:hypothetical protein